MAEIENENIVGYWDDSGLLHADTTNMPDNINFSRILTRDMLDGDTRYFDDVTGKQINL